MQYDVKLPPLLAPANFGYNGLLDYEPSEALTVDQSGEVKVSAAGAEAIRRHLHQGGAYTVTLTATDGLTTVTKQVALLDRAPTAHADPVYGLAANPITGHLLAKSADPRPRRRGPPDGDDQGRSRRTALVGFDRATDTFTYQTTAGNDNWYGTDTFQYVVNDGVLDSAVFTVDVGVNALRIFTGTAYGDDVTGKTLQTVVGAGLGVKALLKGPGFGMVVPPTLGNQQWHVPQTVVKNYDATSGVVTYLTQGEIESDTVHFFWVEAGDPDVVFMASVKGIQIAAGCQCGVAAPTSISFTSHYQPIGNRFKYSRFAQTPYLSFGSPTAGAGVTYSYTATAPTGYGGEFDIVQLVSFVRKRTDYNGVVTRAWSKDEFVLDVTLPAIGHSTLQAGETKTSQDITDSPLTFGDHTTRTLEVNDNFAVFLLYKPIAASGGALADSIYVPIRKFRWGYEASMTNFRPNGIRPKWELDPNSLADVFLQGRTIQFPVWTVAGTTILNTFDAMPPS